MAIDELSLLQTPPPPVRDVAPATPVHDEPMVLNVGPHHPSTHGVLRVVVQLDGERVLSLTPDIGYLHTGIEKTFENTSTCGFVSPVVMSQMRAATKAVMGKRIARILSATE